MPEKRCPLCHGRGVLERRFEDIYGPPVHFADDGTVTYRKGDGTLLKAESRSQVVLYPCSCRLFEFSMARCTE